MRCYGWAYLFAAALAGGDLFARRLDLCGYSCGLLSPLGFGGDGSDEQQQGAARCAGLAAFVGPGSELEKTILEAFKLSTETVHPDAGNDAGEACAE